MTHISRVFNPETRSLTSVERRYAGQTGDALSTVLHFEYTELDFLIRYVPYILFSTLDDEGRPMVYGPAPPDWSPENSKVPFDGVTFAVPWEVPVRAKSARIDYQLFFVKKGVNFDGRDVAKLNPTEVVMSAVDSIAIKPSISCRNNRNPCGCPPFTPTGTEPDVLGYINLWKEYGMVVPAKATVDEDNLSPVIAFRTYNGNNDQDLYLDGVPVLVDGTVPVKQLPVGHTADKLPLLKGAIADGQSIMFSETADGFVAYDVTGIYQFRGTCTRTELDNMERDKVSLSGEPLANGDVYSCTSPRPYGYDEQGNPEVYREGTNWVWSEQDRFEPVTGEMDLSKYQLESAKIDDWSGLDGDVDVTSERKYPTARLVKASLDDKLDDSQIITDITALDPALIGQQIQIPSAKLMKERLDLKTDKTMAIPNWDEAAVYLLGSTVIYNETVFISQLDGNTGNVPIDGEGVISDTWSMIQGGGGGTASDGIAKRWTLVGNGTKTQFYITHNYGVRDLFVSVRERSTNRLVDVPVTVVRAGMVLLTFFEAPAAGEAYYVSISPAVPTQPQEGEIYTMEVTSEASVWTFDHMLHRVVTAQAYDASGNEIVGSVKQNMTSLDRVTMEFNHPHKGTMVVR